MKYSEKKYKYNNEYRRKNYKRIPLDVQLSEYDTIKTAADKIGKPVNGFIKECIREKIDSMQQAGIISGDCSGTNDSDNESNESNNE